MRLRILVVFLFVAAVFVAVRSEPVWSGVGSGDNGFVRTFIPTDSGLAGATQGSWTVENRCRTLYLPVILGGSAGGAGGAHLAPAPPVAGLECIRLSDADLAQLEWDVIAETQARQANRNREAFDMVPLSSWGR
jgi:hypothetical protein